MSVMDAIKRKVSNITGETGDDILETLKREHDEVAEMLARLAESGSGPERKALLGEIRSALVPHLRAEQKVVYDAIIALKGKEQKEHGEEGYLEHEMAERSLNALLKVGNASSPEFSAGAKVLKELVERFSERDRAEMNRKFAAAKKRVRVSPRS